MGANGNAFSDERLTRLRNACCDDSAVPAAGQAALVAHLLVRARASRACADAARELLETKQALGVLLERMQADDG